MYRLLTAAFASLIASIAVGAQAARVVRSKNGDTSVVLIAGYGAWGPVHDAVEVKRISATTKESTFGQVIRAEATADGGVVVFDAKSLDGPIIRQFDADGKFVRNLGRRGSGPGEYETTSLVMTSRPDGSVVVREGNRAVLRFGQDGTYQDGFMLFRTGSVNNEIVAGTDGTYWIRAAFPMVQGNRPMGQPPMIHYDRSGKVLDSIVQHSGWVAPGGAGSWTVNPDGRVMYTRADRVGVLLSDPTQLTAPVIVEIAATPERYLADERKELERLEDFRQAHLESGTSSPRRVVPETKPLAYGAFVDINGRLWQARPGPGQKGTPRIVASARGRAGLDSFTASYQDQLLYVAFQADGTLLGEVRFPPGVIPSFVGNAAWAIVLDADGVPTLVKYRIFGKA